jgi:flagellar basal-body rod protein FlgG
MVYGTHLSSAGMMVNMHRQNVITNNLANVDTVGFKHDLAVFMERQIEAVEDGDAGRSTRLFDNMTGGTLVAETRHAMTQGPAIPTGRPLDVMIEGPGFFETDTPDGTRYTRDGRFAVRDDGTLVTVAGNHPVMSGTGLEIVVGPGAEIDGQGRVLQNGVVVETLSMVDFADPTQLRKEGGNRFSAQGTAGPRPFQAKLASGMLEGSTVDPVNGLATMIQTHRAFELNANFLRLQDQTLGRLVNDVARF